MLRKYTAVLLPVVNLPAAPEGGADCCPHCTGEDTEREEVKEYSCPRSRSWEVTRHSSGVTQQGLFI